MSEVGTVQSCYERFGFISNGRENGRAVYFEHSSVIGQPVMQGDFVRFQIQGDRAINVQLIPAARK